jgi:hypothetical protein
VEVSCGRWSGTSSTDSALAHMLNYLLDELIQAHAVEGKVAEGVRGAVERLMVLSAQIVKASTRHALQQARAAGAKLLRSVLAVLNAPRCVASPNDSAALGERMRGALAEAVAAAEAAAAAARDVATGAPQLAMEAEAAIGFTAAFMTACRHSMQQGGAVLAMNVELIPWALRAQAVSRPEVQGLMREVRRLQKLPTVDIDAARRALASLKSGVQDSDWQIRIAAISMLSTFWYRYSPDTSIFIPFSRVLRAAVVSVVLPS